MMKESNEKLPILEDPEATQQNIDDKKLDEFTETIVVYKRRWYILFVFVLSGIATCIISNAWGPMTMSAKRAFGWTNGDVALLTSWSFTVPVVTGFGVYWLMSERGLRMAMVISNIFLFAGAALRCITFTPPYVTWFMNLGQLLSSVAFNIVLAGANVISATWFPAGQRVIATAIATQAYFIGNMFPNVLTIFFITCTLGRGIVTHLENIEISTNGSFDTNMTANISSSPNYKEINRNEIMNLMYGELVLAAIVLLLVLVYFPSKPPSPPDKTAGIERLNFTEGLKSLARVKTFWVLAVIYALVQGIGNAMMSIINIVIQPAGFGQLKVDIVTAVAVLVSSFFLPFAGLLADKLYSHLKALIVFLYFAVAVFLAWIALMLMQVIPPYFVLNYAIPVTCVVIAINLAVPISLELACEITYPVKEGLPNGIMDYMTNPVGGIILLLMKIPGIGVVWLHFTLITCCVLSVLILPLMKFRYKRTESKTIEPLSD